MAERAADDFVSINARLKEIQAERSKKIEGTPETPAPAAETVYGGTGGFITPDGGYYGGC